VDIRKDFMTKEELREIDAEFGHLATKEGKAICRLIDACALLMRENEELKNQVKYLKEPERDNLVRALCGYNQYICDWLGKRQDECEKLQSLVNELAKEESRFNLHSVELRTRLLAAASKPAVTQNAATQSEKLRDEGLREYREGNSLKTLEEKSCKTCINNPLYGVAVCAPCNWQPKDGA